MRERGLWEILTAEKRADELHLAQVEEEKVQQKLAKEQTVLMREAHEQELLDEARQQRERVEHVRRLFIESGVFYSLKHLAQRKQGEIEFIWDEEQGVYGQRVVWDKKLHGKAHGEHHYNPEGFLPGGWDWGPLVRKFRAKTIEVTIGFHNQDVLEIFGRKRMTVSRTDEDRIDAALGRAYRNPGKISGTKHVSK